MSWRWLSVDLGKILQVWRYVRDRTCRDVLMKGLNHLRHSPGKNHISESHFRRHKVRWHDPSTAALGLSRIFAACGR